MSVPRLFHVTHLDPARREPPRTVPVEASSKPEAAAAVVGRKLKPAPLWKATVSVIGLGEPPRKREYFAET